MACLTYYIYTIFFEICVIKGILCTFILFICYITYIILNMDLITKMERVYIPGTTRFGNIVKKGGLFGLKDSFSIIDDIGKKHVFLGKNIGNFFYVETSENCNGEKCNEGVPVDGYQIIKNCLLYTSPSPRDGLLSRMPSSA